MIKPRIVISKCINFEACRYDGSKISSSIVEKLIPYVEFVPICPELEIGLNTPREALRLLQTDNETGLVSSRTGIDHTDSMKIFSLNYINNLSGIHGFILKSRSPSCGISNVKLYNIIGKATAISRKSRGIFGESVLEKYSYLAIEDEGRLSNLQIREHFLTKIFTLTQYDNLKRDVRSLVNFHSANKYLFMAYNQSQLKTAGKIVANHSKKPIEIMFSDYKTALYAILSRKPRTGSIINVVQHIFGYFSKHLKSGEKVFFLQQIDMFREKKLPLSALTSLLKAWSLRFEQEYLLNQTFFEPFPAELIDPHDSGK